MDLNRPAEAIAALVAERVSRPASAILDELRECRPLPDESDPAWDADGPWERAYLLTALGDVVAQRRLVEGIGLILDLLPLGDPGEMIRGMRHALESAVDPDWNRLVSVCMSRAASPRAGTRFWAVDELGVLRSPAALPVLIERLEDDVLDVAEAACRGCFMVTQEHSEETARVIAALAGVALKRPELRDAAEEAIHDVRNLRP
jgi:hypothetical protein